MENKAVRDVVVFILVLMGIAEMGSIRIGIGLKWEYVALVIIFISSMGCFFFLKLFFHRTEGKKCMETHTVLKSTLISIFFILVIKAFAYGTISVMYDDISIMFALRSHPDTTQTVRPIEESFDSTSNTYYNYTYRFSFKMPEGWKRSSELDEAQIFKIHTKDGGGGLTIAKISSKNISASDFDIQKYMKSTHKQLEESGFNVTKNIMREARISGREATRIDLIFEYKGEKEPLPFRSITFPVIMDGHYFSIIMVVMDSLYENTPDYYDNLFNHFNIAE